MINLKSKKFTPFIGLGNIKFGFAREVIRAMINEPFREFKRNEFARNITDYYRDSMLFMEYNLDNKCDAIEIHKGGDFILNGKNVFNLSYDELLKIYKRTSLKYKEDNFGIIFHDLGFGISIHDNEIETVILFSKDYWN